MLTGSLLVLVTFLMLANKKHEVRTVVIDGVWRLVITDEQFTASTFQLKWVQLLFDSQSIPHSSAVRLVFKRLSNS
jgi:hypothetical protein